MFIIFVLFTLFESSFLRIMLTVLAYLIIPRKEYIKLVSLLCLYLVLCQMINVPLFKHGRVSDISPYQTTVSYGNVQVVYQGVYEGSLGDRIMLHGDVVELDKTAWNTTQRIAYEIENPKVTLIKKSNSIQSRLWEKHENAPFLRSIIFNKTNSILPLISSLSLQVSACIIFMNMLLKPYQKRDALARYEILLIIGYSLVFGLAYACVRMILSRLFSRKNSAIILLFLYPGTAFTFNFLFPNGDLILSSLSSKLQNIPKIARFPSLILLSSHRFNTVEYLMFPVIRIVSGLLFIVALVLPSTGLYLEQMLRLFASFLNSSCVRRFSIVGKPSLIVLLVLILLVYLKRNKAAWVLVCLSVLMMVYPPFFRVSYINVGQGDATLIQWPFDMKTVLIDTGKKSAYKTLRKQLYRLNVSKIDELIITHSDEDHAGGIEELHKDFKVGRIVSDKDETVSGFLNVHSDTQYEDDNENSLMHLLEIKGRRFLFLGDAGLQQERELIQRYPQLKVDILKLGHHGSKTSSSEELISNIEARYAIASSKKSVYNHPHIDVVKRLFHYRVKLLQTEEEGTISFVFSFLLDYVHTQGRGFDIID